jgi:hypothetical protein
MNKPRIENWSLRWKISCDGKVVRRIVGEILDHQEFFNNTEINEEILLVAGREITISLSKQTLTLGHVDKVFLDCIKENGWKFRSNNPVEFIECQMFDQDYTIWSKSNRRKHA